MVTRRLLFALAVFFFFLLTGCNSCEKNAGVSGLGNEDDIKASYKMLPSEQQQVIEVVYRWNEAHNSSEIEKIIAFYGDPVLFFKQRISRESLVAAKKYKINRVDAYKERIIGRVGIYASDTGDYKCEFLKLVTINQQPSVYHSYLIFKKQIDSTWKIIVESDKEADLQPELVSLFEKFKESESLSTGDFNGDGDKEDLIVIKPETDSSGGFSSTETRISFTNLELPEIILPSCVSVNVLNENDVDGDGSDDFSVVVKKTDGGIGDVILFSLKRGKWNELARFRAAPQEVFAARQGLVEFAGSGMIKIRSLEKLGGGKDTVLVKTISTW